MSLFNRQICGDRWKQHKQQHKQHKQQVSTRQNLWRSLEILDPVVQTVGIASISIAGIYGDRWKLAEEVLD